MEAIRTEKLTKSYGKARGIIDLDLRVEQGDFFGFIGPNGPRYEQKTLPIT